ncbi:MAG: single-stranded-DNA-specific exonuclease RecJ [Anaerolineales bacterium]
MTRWLDPTPIEVPASFSTLGLHPLVEQTLLRYGINSPEEAEAFLHPEKTPSTPFPNIQTAVDRILLAIRSREKICVWGDFDVDGQTSTTLLVQTLRALGGDVMYYIPVRGKESHGVHVASLQPILENGITLLVTCDTGITAHEAIDYANSRGVDVVVTDHHDLGETLPNAKAIVNPKLLSANHPLANLAGVGVAYKLAEALLSNEPQTTEHESSIVHRLASEDLLDLVALGLIADVALLKGETRTLTQKGIRKLRETQRLGLKVMAELSGTNLETLTEETIGFTFAPRLNALGRLGDANPAVELLLTEDSGRARVLAAQIEGLNSQRRLLTSQVYQAAEAQLHASPELLEEPAIVLSHPNWPGGVVGIVANKLVNRYHKPAILFNESEDGILRGSARSIEGLHITEAITTQRNLLHGFGGHPMAAGMSLHADKLIDFRKGLGKAIEKQLGEAILEEPTLQIDAWLDLEDLTLDMAEALEMLAPFGAGNPSLTLATRKLKLKSVSTIGKTKEHIRLNVEDENGIVQSILWWGGAGETMPEGIFDVAYSIRAATFRGQKQLSVQLEEFRILEDEQPIEIQKSGIEIVDLRLKTKMFESLSTNHLVWAEGNDKSKGIARFDLKPSNEFVIYTTPPSHIDLRTAMEIVKPQKIYIVAMPPAEEKPEDFLNRLAGLCKYALNKREGKATLHELTAAMASRENAIEIGLDWLAASGLLLVEVNDDDITLSTTKAEKNPYLQSELFLALRGILNEISAFRKFIATTNDLEKLFH